MSNFIGISNILISLSFISILLILSFPFHRWLSKFLEIQISKTFLIWLIPLIFAFIVSLRAGILGVAFLIISLFISWALLFAFNANRKYAYILALIFLGLTPFFLLLKLDKIAEYLAILCYLALVMGVAKDILYEKIFTK